MKEVTLPKSRRQRLGARARQWRSGYCSVLSAQVCRENERERERERECTPSIPNEATGSIEEKSEGVLNSLPRIHHKLLWVCNNLSLVLLIARSDRA